MLHQMPDAPINLGKMMRQGRRNNNCLVSERKMALLASPILWKKLDVTIWKPTIGKTITTIRKPSAARAISPESLVNIETVSSGISSPTRKVSVVTNVAPQMESFKTWFTRSNCWAP